VLSANRHTLPIRIATHGDRLCLRTLSHAYVDVHGNVAPCCAMRGMVMGNLLERSLPEIWNSERFERFFAGQEEVCAKCDALRSEHRG
jgi:radical SAM protein with 4Fe4S-binding SPASM domain